MSRHLSLSLLLPSWLALGLIASSQIACGAGQFARDYTRRRGHQVPRVRRVRGGAAPARKAWRKRQSFCGSALSLWGSPEQAQTTAISVRLRSISIGRSSRKKTTVVLRGPDGQEIPLKLHVDYRPLTVGGKGTVSADIIFAGYGINAPKLDYNDFESQSVKDKVMLIIRREPQQGQEKSAFDGKKTTPHAYIRTKLKVAKEQGAAAILMVNDPYTTTSEGDDKLTPLTGFGNGRKDAAIFHASQTVRCRPVVHGVSPRGG